MAEQLQYRRGTASQIAAFTGAPGEGVVDTTNNRFVVCDGSTVGGWPAAKLAEVITNRRVPIGDADYTAAATDRTIAYTSLTAARTVTLPAASAYPTGTRLAVVDESGSCSVTLTLTLLAAGSDMVNGAASVALKVARGTLSVTSNGSAWTIVDQPPGGPTGVVQIAVGGTGVSGARAARYTVAALAVNANSVADTAIAIPLPAGITRYRVAKVTALNPSVSLTSAQAGLFTSTGGGGAALCAAQALSGLTTNAANTAGNAIDLTRAASDATFFTAATLYFRITTAQGSAATVDVVIEIQPY